MQPIVWIVIVGVAAVAMSTGFLSTDFAITAQNLGVAETNLVSPINTASIDFTISKISGINPVSNQPLFKNRIIACSFHSPTALLAGTTIICKLTDDDDDVIAEGKIVLTTVGYAGSSPGLNIPIQQTAFPNANSVQEVHDVKIVVLDPTPAIFTP